MISTCPTHPPKKDEKSLADNVHFLSVPGNHETNLEKIRRRIGHPLEIPCRQSGSVPKAGLSWEIADDVNAVESTLVELDGRRSVDENGIITLRLRRDGHHFCRWHFNMHFLE